MKQQVRPNDPRVAVAYLRTATTERGADEQRRTIDSWAAPQGVTVVEWHYDSGVNGLSDVDQRSALSAALAAIEARGAGLLVVASSDRLARDVRVVGRIEGAVRQRGARVATAL